MSNRLSQEKSSYLRSAAHQPIDWYPWCNEAFERARALDRPLLLDIGAVWCHWCHVMDGESYENPEIAQLINERFVPIKVDRDEHPDIDSRYQQAVGAITGQGGWPLTAFLTYEGDVFFGGTYFPPDNRYGRPGFKSLLLQVSDYYTHNKEKVFSSAKGLQAELIRHAEISPEQIPPSSDILAMGVEQICRNFDPVNGGFGGAPKFPHPSAIDLLIAIGYSSQDQTILSITKRTLEKMAKGGIHDQIGGGFHRYSTDERWIVPHFEKMSYDNSELLKNYLHAYQVTGDDLFRETVLGTIRYITTVLSDQERGGFFASQDADIGMRDDGDYFTWTLEEARAVLSPEEGTVIALYYNIQPRGEMHTNPAKNVLFVDLEPDTIAVTLNMDREKVTRIIARAKKKMCEARLLRPTPFVDRALYLNWNGMMISAFLEASFVLGLGPCKEFALKSLDFFLSRAYTPEKGFYHSLVDGEPRVPGFLDDQVQMGVALLDAYQATAERKYAGYAEQIATILLEKYWDQEGKGFFDLSSDATRIGGLTRHHKPIQDAPTPAANAVAVLFFDRLYYLTGQEDYRHIAEETLQLFSESCKGWGSFAATYFLALHLHLRRPPHVVIIGNREKKETRALWEAAMATYRPGKYVTVCDPDIPSLLPSPLSGVLSTIPKEGAVAYICGEAACAPPVRTPEELAKTLTKPYLC